MISGVEAPEKPGKVPPEQPRVELEKPPKRPVAALTNARRVRAMGAIRPALDPTPGVGEVGPQREGGATVCERGTLPDQLLSGRRCDWHI